MKKFLSLVLVLAMLMSFAVPASAAESGNLTLSADKTVVNPGETITLTLELDYDLTGVYALQYHIYFNSDLLEFHKDQSSINIDNKWIVFGDGPNNDGVQSDDNGSYVAIYGLDTDTVGELSLPKGTVATYVFTAKEAVSGDAGFVFYEEAIAGEDLLTKPATAPTMVSNVDDVAVGYSVTVSESENGSVTADKAVAAANDTITLTPAAAEGFELDEITVTDASGAAVTVTDNTFTMPASNVTVAATFNALPVAAGYSVTASSDVSITAGENAEVSITVTEADSKAYNAYELNISYPEGLTYVSASGSGVEGDNFQANHDETNRTIQIIGYGADKASGTAAAMLTFTGTAAGEYDVTITSAKVDAAAAAPTQNTPDATITDTATKITITGYTVTLGEGLTADSTVAYAGTDYTFKATDAGNYDYTVTAKVGDDEITVNDNGDGTYTIPGASVTGNITVTAAMTPKSYDVTYDGTTTENAATYKTDYVFTPEQEGFTVGGVTVTIGGGDPYTGYNNVDGTYTIPGADITGDIVITIDWVEETPATVTVNKGEGVIGGDTATEGEDYTFSFGDTEDYEYDEESLKVTVGDTDITDKVTKNEEIGEYTIPGELITGDITIEVTRTEKSTLTVEVNQYLTLDAAVGNMYLVTVKGVPEGSVAKYDGMTMYWSEKYDAYAWLVISTDTLENVKTAAAAVVTAAEGTADLTVDYSGDVNGTGIVDVNDAQLVYNMYNAYYGDFDTATRQMFLDADMTGDGTVNVSDAAAVVSVITAQ